MRRAIIELRTFAPITNEEINKLAFSTPPETLADKARQPSPSNVVLVVVHR
jgi:hypothetical protein